jgi:hypothetical protein
MLIYIDKSDHVIVMVIDDNPCTGSLGDGTLKDIHELKEDVHGIKRWRR